MAFTKQEMRQLAIASCADMICGKFNEIKNLELFETEMDGKTYYDMWYVYHGCGFEYVGERMEWDCPHEYCDAATTQDDPVLELFGRMFRTEEFYKKLQLNGKTIV